MKSLLPCLGLLLAGTGALRAADEDARGAKKGADRTGRAVAALDAIQKAIPDLPPGADLDRIKKAFERIREQIAKEVQGRLSMARADFDVAQDRAAWSQRLCVKGCVSRAQALADKERVRAAWATLERAQADFNALQATRPVPSPPNR